MLREQTGERRPWRSLVAIQRGDDRPPFFCVHGAGGNVLNFRPLARGLDRAQPFFGLQARGVDGELPPHGSIEEMARAYVSEVCEACPHGPYMLGGYSGGGLVAYEMARLLTAAGARVELLALLDTYHPATKPKRFTLGSRIARLREEGVGYLLAAVRRRGEARVWAANQSAIERHLARGEILPFELRDQHLLSHFRRVAVRYRPPPWPGRVTLFRAARLISIYEDPGPTYGWERCALGGVEVVAVQGDHRSMMAGENGALLVRSLRAAVERAAPVATRSPECPCFDEP